MAQLRVAHKMHTYTVIPRVLYIRRWGLKRWSLAFGKSGRHLPPIHTIDQYPQMNMKPMLRPRPLGVPSLSRTRFWHPASHARSSHLAGATSFNNTTVPSPDAKLSRPPTNPTPPPLSLLALPTLIRSYLVSAVSASPILLTPSLWILSLLAHSKLPFLQVEHNRLLHYIIKKTIYAQFCAGETPPEVQRTATQLKETGYRGIVLNYAKELVFDKAAPAKQTRDDKAKDLEDWKQGLLKTVKLVDSGDYAALKFSGAGPSVVQRLIGKLPPTTAVSQATKEICDYAKDTGIKLLWDAEQNAIQPGIDRWTLDLQREYNRDGVAVLYGTYQAYAISTPQLLAQHLAIAHREGFTLGVKLVRGAYMGSDPRHLFWASKAETDRVHDRIAEALIRKEWNETLSPVEEQDAQKPTFPNVSLVLATHNHESVRKAVAIRQEQSRKGEELIDLSYAQLMGMADDLVGFSLQPFSQKNSYNVVSPPGPCVEPEGFNDARLPLMMDPADTNAAIEMLKSKPPPPYLGLFNEPDLSYGGYTAVTLPEDAAKNLTTLIDVKQLDTRLLSPVPAYPSPDWLDQFDGNCTGCMDKIDIISAHVYHVKPEDSVAQIKAIHDRWQKPIWVTEISPTTQMGNCQFSGEEMKTCSDKSANLSRARSRVLEAAQQGASLIVLPECFNSPYGCQYFPKYAETLLPSPPSKGKAPSFHALSDLAKEANAYLLGGSIPEYETTSDKYFNTSLMFNPNGELIATHRKVHLFDIDIPGKITFKESEILSPGNKLTLVDLPEYGRIALAICYDIRFPELAMIAARKQCFLLLYPGAFNLTTGALHWSLQARARAMDNQVYVGLCSPARDMEASYNAWGHSMVVDPNAAVMTEAGENEEIVYADLVDSKIQETRKGIPLQGQRRFDVYPDVSKGNITFEEG
ncbi:MAG: hypothetical protein Q9205_001075 [Flavoplaca limonia]